MVKNIEGQKFLITEDSQSYLILTSVKLAKIGWQFKR